MTDTTLQEAVQGFRLSPQQRRLWRLRGEGAPCRAQCVLSLSGAAPEPPSEGLDGDRLAAAVETALAAVVGRHEILRTAFEPVPGMRVPVQRIAAGAAPELERRDLSALPAVEQRRRRRALLRRDAAEAGDAARFVLLDLGQGRYELYLGLSALCADAWTLRLLARELGDELARRQGGGAAPPDGDEILQYADFAEWQNGLLEEDEADEALAYWRFQDVTAVPAADLPLDLPGDRAEDAAPAPAAPAPDAPRAPSTCTVVTPADTVAGLEGLASSAGVDLPVLLLAAWGHLLGRFSNQAETLVGRHAHGRRYEELRQGLGAFARALPTRLPAGGAEPLATLARSLAPAVAEADGWQEYFDAAALAEGDGVLRLDLGFTWEERPAPRAAGPLRVAVEEQRVLAEPFRLELAVRRGDETGDRDGGGGQTLVSELRFDPAGASASAVQRLARGWDALLRDAARRPAAAARELRVLGEEDEARLLRDFNPAPRQAAGEPLLHQRIAARAAMRPDAVAVTSPHGSLTYGELARRADRLARHLRDLGVGPEVPVALALERSPHLAVAWLGVLKAGGAVLPLDLASPPARLAFVLADAGARHLLTAATTREWAGRELIPALEGGAGSLTRVCLDGDAAELAARPDGTADGARDEARNVTPGPDSLAYVTYTSGTTGRPKGVLSTHRGAVSYLDHAVRAHGLDEGSVVLQVAAPFFDASVRDLLGPLTAGARVVLPAEEEARNPGALLQRLREDGVNTVLSLVPTLFRELVRAAGESPGPVTTLRRVVLSGERLRREDGAAARRLFGDGVAVVNQYGPTEGTMTSSFWAFPPAGAEGSGPAPVGGPIDNVRFYVVDRLGRPVPVGVAGELWIGGAGVTRGYCRRPGATAERYLPDPFVASVGSDATAGAAGARLYRTGDLVRWRPDGILDFLGRRDRQVKVRGMRVEPDEVEAVLTAHPGVVEAAVVPVREGTALAAYVVTAGRSGHDRAAPGAGELRQALRRSLPEALVPSFVVLLPSLPRTRTGKLDRAALPDPEQAVAAAGAPPEGPVETRLAAIWCEVLGLPEVGREDSFFDLGGHSLLAAQLTARVQEAFDVHLPLRTLFEVPTVATLAQRVEAGLGEGAGDGPGGGAAAAEVPDLVPVPRDGRLPVSFAQQRLWFLQQLDPETCAFNVPRGVRLRGPLGPRQVSQLAGAVGHVVARHEALRTTFGEVGGEPYQVVHPARPVPLPVVDLSALPDSPPGAASGAHREADRLGRAQARRPFDLETGPLLRMSLLRLAGDDHRLLFNVHHVVSDDWSMGLLVSEVSAAYRALARDEPMDSADLPRLPVQYADYAVWQRRWLRGEALERRLDWWRRRLATPPPELSIPFAKPRPESPDYAGDHHAFRVPPRVAGALKELARQEGATLFMVLLAVFQTLLHSYSGEEDVAVGTDVANRDRVETERLIGFFVNVLVLRTDLGGNPTFRELLARVREVALGAFSHQEVPFERLVQELQPERTSRRAPLFQHLLVLQNPDRRRLELPGLSLEPFEIDNRTVKFDLVLVMVEDGDGLAGIWKYSTDLFDAAGIERLTRHFHNLLESASAEPDRRLSQLDHLAADERTQDAMEKKQRKKADFAKFMDQAPTAVKVSRGSLVDFEPLPGDAGGAPPLLARPAAEAVDLAEWVEGNRQTLEDRLHDNGAVLFRGFDVASAEDFEAAARAVCGELFSEYGDLPRDAVEGQVYTSTPYPPGHTIWFHNESSQLDRWPLRQFFFCVQPAPEGGETPLVDCRQVYRRLDPEVRDRFERLGVMYVRNFTPGLDVDWQDFFHTSDRDEVEAWCRESDVACEWKPDGGLRTRKVCPAVAHHPRTGEKVFFNQIQAHHVSCLPPEDRRSLLDLFDVEDLPRNVYYGDGSPIPDGLVQEIVDLYRRNAYTFPWQAGDLVMVDNMLTAHGRYPFSGPRKILVAMGDMVSIDEVRTAGLRHATV